MSDSNWFDLLNNKTNGYVTTAIDATNDTAYDYNGAPPTTVPDTINAVIATIESKARILGVISNVSTFNMNAITQSIDISSITVYQTVLDNSLEYIANLNILNATTGSNASVNATINEIHGNIANIGVLQSGTGYYQANLTVRGGGYVHGVPAVYIDPPTNTNATIAKASTSISSTGGVSYINVVDPGSGYTEPPVVTIQGPSDIHGTPASANAIVLHGEIHRFEITNPGSGYTSEPIVFIDLPTRQATAYCTVDTQTPYGLTAVVLTDPGTGYTESPNVTIADYNTVYNFTSAINTISMSNVDISNSFNGSPPSNQNDLDTFLFQKLIGLTGNVDTTVSTSTGSLYAQLINPSNPNSFFSQVWKLVDMFQQLFYSDIGAAQTYIKQQIEYFGSNVNDQVQSILLKKSSLPHTVRTALAQLITNELIAFYLADANQIITSMESIMVTIEQLATAADITFSLNKTGTYFMASSDNLYQLTQDFITTYKSIPTGVTTKYFPNGRTAYNGNNAVAYLKQSTDAYISAVQSLVTNYKTYVDNAISETLIISNRLKNMHDTYLKPYILSAPNITKFINQTLSLNQNRIYTLTDDYLESQSISLYSFNNNQSLLSSSSLYTPPIITCDLGLALFPSYETLDEAHVYQNPVYLAMTSGTSQWVSNLPYILPIFSVMTNTDYQDTLCNTINPITSLVWAKMYYLKNYSYISAKDTIEIINTQLDADGLDPFLHDVYPQALVQDTYGIQLTRLMSKIYFTWAVMYQNGDSLANPGSKDNIAQFYLLWANYILGNGSDTDLITALVGTYSDSFTILTQWFPLFDAATTLVDLIVLKYIPQTVPTSSFIDNMTNIFSDIQDYGLQHAIDDGNYTYFPLTQTTTSALSYETVQTNVYNIHQGLFMFMTLLMQSNYSLTEYKKNMTKTVPPPPFKVTKNSGIRLNKVPTPATPTPTTFTPVAKTNVKQKNRAAPDWKRRTIR
jgi:hypothetical protein